MTESFNLYIPLWTAAVAAHLALTYKFKEKWEVCKERLVEDVDSYNADRGFDLSISPELLAQDLLFPFRTSNIDSYAKRQGVSSTSYRKDLKREVSRPYLFSMFLALQILFLIGTVGGFVGLSHFGSWYPNYFFGFAYSTLIANLVIYLIQ